MSETVFRVSIPNTARDYFDYSAPSLTPAIGARVWVPFRRSQRLGIVIDILHEKETPYVLKAITEVIDEQPLIDAALLRLYQFIARYYQAPLSEVLALALPKKYREGARAVLPERDFYQLIVAYEDAVSALNKRQIKLHALIERLNDNGRLSADYLKTFGIKKTHLDMAVLQGLIECVRKTSIPAQPLKDMESPLTLNEEQQQALSAILAHCNHYHCFLLQGVTGSGKTEVYLQAIEKILALEKQVLILVPEIGLTPQLLSRFQKRFPLLMVVLHSHLNETERQIAWQLAKEGIARIVIGTRSALFTPMPQLGLIIVDEEHDLSLKQMDGVRYHARDVALVRAHQSNIPIILGSATPSLESLLNCQNHKYSRLTLTKRAISRTPLHMQLIDIRQLPLFDGLSKPVLDKIGLHLGRGHQVLVFINRRGFAPVLLCQDCSQMIDCKSCDSHLTLHKNRARLICHHCGATRVMPLVCDACHKANLVAVGVGTERVEDALREHFPKISLVRLDRDEVRKKETLERYLEGIANGQYQLIIGTQMLAKGHDFPNVTLVVILDADNGLCHSDFRAQERLGQLLTQVAGRAGRGNLPGEVVIQTTLPSHPMLLLLLKQGFDAYAAALLASRDAACLPPYHYLALIRASGRRSQEVLSFLHALKEQLSHLGVNALGPAPAPLARKEGYFQLQLLVKSDARQALQRAIYSLRQWIITHKINGSLRYSIDIDPMDLS